MTFISRTHCFRMLTAFNALLANALRAKGLTVFLPQETEENTNFNPTGRQIFISDVRRIRASRILLSVLADGDVLDDGVACEIGIAVGLGIPVVGI